MLIEFEALKNNYVDSLSGSVGDDHAGNVMSSILFMALWWKDGTQLNPLTVDTTRQKGELISTVSVQVQILSVLV